MAISALSSMPWLFRLPMKGSVLERFLSTQRRFLLTITSESFKWPPIAPRRFCQPHAYRGNRGTVTSVPKPSNAVISLRVRGSTRMDADCDVRSARQYVYVPFASRLAVSGGRGGSRGNSCGVSEKTWCCGMHRDRCRAEPARRGSGRECRSARDRLRAALLRATACGL